MTGVDPALIAGFLELERRTEQLAVIDQLVQSLFPQQRKVFRAALKMGAKLAVLCSRRSGKSWVVAVILIALCLTHPGGLCLWLGLDGENIAGIVAPIVAKLKRLFGLKCIYNGATHTYRFANDSAIEIDGPGKKPLEFAEKYLGRPLIAAVIEEAGSWSPALLKYVVDTVIEPSLVDENGSIIMVGTPREIMTGLYYNATRGADPEWTAYHWTAFQNPHMAAKWRKRLKKKIAANPNYESTPTCRREDYGEWVKDGTKLVYSEFNPAVNVIHKWAPEPGDRFTLIHDPGWASAAAFVITCQNAKTHPATLVVVESEKHIRMRTDQVADRIRSYQQEYPSLDIVADPTWNVSADLNGPLYDLQIRSAQKHQKWSAISDLNGAMADGRIKVLYHSNLALIDELEKLPTRIKPDGTLAEDTKKFDNHLTDCLLYGYRDARDEIRETAPKPVLSMTELARRHEAKRRKGRWWEHGSV